MPEIRAEEGALVMRTQTHVFYNRNPYGSVLPAAALEAAAVPRNALHIAAEHGDARSIRRLLELDAEVDEKDAQGRTPLHIAVRHRQLKAAAELIAAGASLNAETRDGWTPLSIAVKTGSPLMIDLVVRTLGDAGKGL
jgi:ankyrin repeat protein